MYENTYPFFIDYLFFNICAQASETGCNRFKTILIIFSVMKTPMHDIRWSNQTHNKNIVFSNHNVITDYKTIMEIFKTVSICGT